MMKRIAAACAALALFALGAANAQYPNKPVKVIVPFPAGQATDLAARIIAEALGKEWNQSVVVENVGGGAGIPGMVTGKNAPADGYTLIMGTSAVMVVNPAIMDKLPYDPLDRLHADRAGVPQPAHHRGHRQVAVQDAEGRRGCREEGARQAELGLSRRGHHAAPHGRALQAGRGRGHPGRDVQGQRGDGAGPAGRLHPALGRRHRPEPAAHQVRQAARAGLDRRGALHAAARHAHGGRAGLSRLLRRGLGRRGGAQGRAQRPRAEDLAGPEQGHERPGVAGAADRGRPRDRQHAARRSGSPSSSRRTPRGATSRAATTSRSSRWRFFRSSPSATPRTRRRGSTRR